MSIDQRRDEILSIAARHGARNVRVFGSVARGDDRPDSDIDLLVDMDADRVASGSRWPRPGGEQAFLADRMRQDAIIRKLEIIGEAVKQLSDETRARRHEIPWSRLQA